jgi:hypothetical protein
MGIFIPLMELSCPEAKDNKTGINKEQTTIEDKRVLITTPQRYANCCKPVVQNGSQQAGRAMQKKQFAATLKSEG